MTVRAAVLSDVLDLVRIAKLGHASSIYRDVGVIDEAYARQFFIQAIGQDDKLLLVSHLDEDLRGYFMGYVDRVYQIGNLLTATDVHLFLSDGADPRDASRMLSEFIDWAHKNPCVVEIIVGRTDIISMADSERYEAMLIRKGFERFGRIYRMPVVHRAEHGLSEALQCQA